MGHHLNTGAGDGRRAWDIPTIGLFTLVTSTGLIGVPLFGYVYGYTKLDWALACMLYLISGLGITVGYHRMIAHRSFRCRDWVKVAFLVAGSLAMENSALKGRFRLGSYEFVLPNWKGEPQPVLIVLVAKLKPISPGCGIPSLLASVQHVMLVLTGE